MVGGRHAVTTSVFAPFFLHTAVSMAEDGKIDSKTFKNESCSTLVGIGILNFLRLAGG